MKISKFFRLFIVTLLMISCNRHSRDMEYTIDFLPCEDVSEQSGYIGTKGIFYASQNDNIYPVINEYGVVDGTLYKFDSSLSDTIPIIGEIESYGIMNDGLIPICKEEERITIIDTNGKDIFQLKEFDSQEVLGCYSYSDSKLRVKLEDYSYIYVGKDGNKLFDTRYSYATDFKNGFAVVQTINQNENLYSLIDDTGTPCFTFESEDEKYIVVSHDMELLSSKENGNTIIYDFSGKRILKCPVKVDRIYAYCQDGFVFFNDDEKLGLMSYEGEILIRPRYQQLIPYENNYLANNDSEVRLVNKNDEIIKEFEAGEILDFMHAGYNFPSIIITSSDDNCMIIDYDGNVIAEDFEIDQDYDDIESLNFVRSHYFPSDEVMKKVMKFIGSGIEASDQYGAFFNRTNSYCTPNNISFLSTSFTKQDLEGRTWARINVSEGVNYSLKYCIRFDSPIVRIGESDFNTTAWLKSVELHISMPDILMNQVFLNRCVSNIVENGCKNIHNKKTDYLLLDKNNDKLYVIYHNWKNVEYEFRILILPNTESNRNYYMGFIDGLE